MSSALVVDLVDELEDDETKLMPDEGEEVEVEAAMEAGPVLHGMTVCLTGALSVSRAEFEGELAALGAIISKGLTKAVTHLVTADASSISSKSQKAKKQGTEIVNEEWMRLKMASQPSQSQPKKAVFAAKTASAASKKRKRKVIVLDSSQEQDDDNDDDDDDDDEDFELDGAEAEAEVEVEVEAGPAPITPKRAFADGEVVELASGSSDATYRCKRVMDHYTCSCPAWRNQRFSPTVRSCKHLKELLGADFEAARCGSNASPGAAAAKRRKVTVSKTGKTAGGEAAPPSPSGKVVIKCMLAKKFEPSKTDPTGYHMSEKYDGVRALWEPAMGGGRMFSRLGNPFPVPQSFLDLLPADMRLDGELFAGRGQFAQTISIVKTEGKDVWPDHLEYHVFDAPGLDGDFEQRLAALEQRLTATATAATATSVAAGRVKVVQHTVCKGLEHLESEMDRVIGLGGEGVMLRKPNTAYPTNRSATLLKHKRFLDAEGEVAAHEPGKGKHTGVMGAVTVKMASGNTFRVGSGFTDAQRKAPPKIGSLITYRYQELTASGVPRFPTFVGMCVDKDKPTL